MKSNRSLFNATLFKSNIKRFLPFSIIFLIFELIIFPLSTFVSFMTFSTNLEGLEYDSMLGMSIASNIFTFFFAGALSLIVFSYMFSSNKCNALHAFPIGRKSLFVTNTLSTYVLLIAPQIIAYAITVPLFFTFSKSASEVVSAILIEVASIFLYSFIVLAFGILAVMLSGNAFSAAVIYYILNFLYSALVGLASYGVYLVGKGLPGDTIVAENDFILSPVVNIISHMMNIAYKEDVSEFYIPLVIYFIAAIVLCFLAYFLYKLRSVEVAGEMVAFNIETPFIRVIVSVIGGAMNAMFLGTIMGFSKAIFFSVFIAFSFIYYFAAQMIMKKKFNIFTWKLVIGWLITCAVSIGVVIGIASYQTNYVPSAAATKNVQINIQYNMDIDAKGEVADDVIALHKALIEYSKNRSDGLSTEGIFDGLLDDSMYNDDYRSVSLTYTLKDGKEIIRQYDYYLDDDTINSLIKKIESKTGYEATFEFLEKHKIDYSIESITYTVYYEETENTEYKVSPEDFEKVMELCKKESKLYAKSYSVLDKGTDEELSYEIWFSGKTKNLSEEALDELDMISSTFCDGYFYVDNYEYNPSQEIEIYIDSLPKDSETIKYILEHGKAE